MIENGYTKSVRHDMQLVQWTACRNFVKMAAIEGLKRGTAAGYHECIDQPPHPWEQNCRGGDTSQVIYRPTSTGALARGGQQRQNWAAPTSTQPYREKAALRAQWQHLAMNELRYQHSKAVASAAIS